MLLESLIIRISRPVSIAPLVTFRIFFGLMMFCGTLRFWLKGWIIQQYVLPKFYFTYQGFDWVHPLGSWMMHLLFAFLLLCSLMIAVGLLYRMATIVFFLSFTYIELIDITNYLNHYYFISLLSFLLIFLPAHRLFSLDVYIRPHLRKTWVPLWTIGIIRLQIALVYFFAGLAKLNYPWLMEALPMRIWLPAKSYIPVVGEFLYEPSVAYLFSWFGAVYDLLIAFFLINGKTRPTAYIFVFGFHAATAIFFPEIGMFPYIMVVCSFIFLSSDFHQKIFDRFARTYTDKAINHQNTWVNLIDKNIIISLLSIYFFFQLLVPMRYLFYPGNLYWAEEGYRFSWRVMLMEKSGISFFTVRETSSGKTYEVNNKEFLTPLQEKMMSTQPDMILRYAHYLKKVYKNKGIHNPAVFVQCFVALNGDRSRLFVDSTIDLSKQELSFKHYGWVMPYKPNE